MQCCIYVTLTEWLAASLNALISLLMCLTQYSGAMLANQANVSWISFLLRSCQRQTARPGQLNEQQFSLLASQTKNT